MLNTPAILQSKLDALNLTQIINEPTRYNPKSVNTGTLIDIILTNSPSKYTSAVFNQVLSDHCLIACIRNGSAVKRPPLIPVKCSLKHFSEQVFLFDLAGVSWNDIDLIPATDLYLSYPAFLRSSKAKLTNRLPTIWNLTIHSLLCNLVSELVMGAPQPRSRS